MDVVNAHLLKGPTMQAIVYAAFRPENASAEPLSIRLYHESLFDLLLRTAKLLSFILP